MRPDTPPPHPFLGGLYSVAHRTPSTLVTHRCDVTLRRFENPARARQAPLLEWRATPRRQEREQPRRLPARIVRLEDRPASRTLPCWATLPRCSVRSGAGILSLSCRGSGVQ